MYRIVTVVLFLTAISAEDVSLQNCPVSLDDNNNCDCIEAYGKLFLTCKGVNDTDLKQSFQKMKGREINTLSIIGSKLAYFSSKLLSDLKVSKMKISNSKLYHLADDSFDGPLTETLTELKIDGVQFVEGMDLTVFENMQKLTVISVMGTNVEHVSAMMTAMELNLETLSFSDDGIEYVHDHAFSTCKSLKNLILNHNYIHTFKRSMLPLPTSEIQFLDLSHNELSSLPDDAFDGMPKLHSLLLHRNRFKVLEKTYMSKVWNHLFYFSVHNNPLVCDCRMSWLTEGSRKPFHLLGECNEPSSNKGKKLKEIEKSDLEMCLAQS